MAASITDRPVMMEVVLEKFIDPVTVWVRKKSKVYPSPELKALTDTLTAYCTERDGYWFQRAGSIQREKLVAVRIYKKAIWARGVIKEPVMTMQGNKLHVFLIDSAETVIVPQEWIRDLPESCAQLPPQVVCIHLPGLHPLGLHTDITSDVSAPLKVVQCLADSWDSASLQYVKNILREHTTAYIECLQPDLIEGALKGRLHVEVRGKTFCLNDTLVSEKFATPCTGIPNCLHRSCRLAQPLEVKIPSSRPGSDRHSDSSNTMEDMESLSNTWHEMRQNLDRQINEVEVEHQNLRQNSPPEVKKPPLGRGMAMLNKYMKQMQPRISPASGSNLAVGEGALNVMHSAGDSAKSDKCSSSNVTLEPAAQHPAEELCPDNHLRSNDNIPVQSTSTIPLLDSKNSTPNPVVQTAGTSNDCLNLQNTINLSPAASTSPSSLRKDPAALFARLKAARSGSIPKVPSSVPQPIASPVRNTNEVVAIKTPAVPIASAPSEARIEPTQVSLPNATHYHLFPEYTSESILHDQTSVFKEGYRHVFVQGESPGKPVTSLLQTPFATCLKKQLQALNYQGPIFLQHHVWPSVLRGRHVVLIGRSRSGKTLGYLLPLLTLVLQPTMYSKTPVGNGPLVLVLCSSLESAQGVYRHCETFAGDSASVILVTSLCSETKLKIDLMNGCDVVIATPSRFLNMLDADEGRVTNLKRLCHLVIDDAHLLTEKCVKALTQIALKYLEHRAKLPKSQIRNCPSQIVVCGEIWTPGMKEFVNVFMLDELVYISSLLEATIFSGLKVLPHVCSSAMRDNVLTDLLYELGNRKIVICVARTKTTLSIRDLLHTESKYVLVINSDLSVSEVDEVAKEWHMAHSATSHPILVVSDDRLSDLNIINANCLIHYDLPTLSKGLFGDRFAFLLHGLQMAQREISSPRSIYSSHILITEQCAPQAQTLVDYLSRVRNVTVPKELAALAAGRLEGMEENAEELCESWKAFGNCRATRRCIYRHTVDFIKDKSNVLNCGTVKVMVTYIVNASKYFVRILEHRPPEGKTVDFKMAYWHLYCKLNLHFSKEENRCAVGVVKVGTCCAFLDENGAYHRILVKSLPDRDQYVKSFFMETGKTEKILLANLLKLPDDLQAIPQQAFEVYLCNVMPADNNPKWSIRANVFVHDLILGKELVGKVTLALGTTLWLHPLRKPTLLDTVRVTIWEFDVAVRLISQGFASENSRHLQLLGAISAKVWNPAQPAAVEDPSLKMDSGAVLKSSTPSETLAEGPLAIGSLQHVYVSYVLNPALFYVQKDEFADRFDQMTEEINKEASILPPPGEVITSELYLAPFPPDNKFGRARADELRDDGSIRVFGVDFGDYAIISKSNLRIMPPHYEKELPYQAVPCTLAGVAPTSGSTWPMVAVDALWNLVLDEEQLSKKLTLKVSKQLPPPPGNKRAAQYEVFLYDECVDSTVSLNEKLVLDNLAVKILSESFPNMLMSERSDGESLAATHSDSADPAFTANDRKVPIATQGKTICKLPDTQTVSDKGGVGDSLTTSDNVTANRQKVAPVKQQSVSLAAPIRWHQTDQEVILNIVLSDIETYTLKVSSNHVHFSAIVKNQSYTNDLDLYADVNEINKRIIISGPTTTIRLPKIIPSKWPQLLNRHVKFPWLSVNFDHLDISSDSSSEEHRVRLPPTRSHTTKVPGRSRTAKPAGFYRRRGLNSTTNSDDDDNYGEDSGHDDHLKL